MTVKKTILCVDNEQSLSIQKVTLETRGYRVVTCNTAAEAMSIFGQGTVDLVLRTSNCPTLRYWNWSAASERFLLNFRSCC